MLTSLSRLIFRLFLLTLLLVQLSVPMANATEIIPSSSSPKIELKGTETTPVKSDRNPDQTSIDHPQKNTQPSSSVRGQTTSPTSPDPYDTESIEKFNEELYGE